MIGSRLQHTTHTTISSIIVSIHFFSFFFRFKINHLGNKICFVAALFLCTSTMQALKKKKKNERKDNAKRRVVRKLVAKRKQHLVNVCMKLKVT